MSVPLVLIFLGLLWFVLCRHLSSEWSLNEQYSYGWFVPFFAAYLFWLRFEDRPPAGGYQLSGNGYKEEAPAIVAARARAPAAQTVRPNNRQPLTGTATAALAVAAELSDGGERLSGAGAQASSDNKERLTGLCLTAAAVIALALLLPLRLFEIGNPDWRPLGWLHSAIVVGFTFYLLWRAGGAPWVRHFAFPVAFIFVAVPWISPIEQPIIQGLMRGVAAIAAETLNLFGIPAELQGSLIRVSTGLVGVNEACSGVRSLQTSIMIGLLFGELKRFTVGRRLGLVAGALAIALIANCLRALFLVWIAATREVSAVDKWHDIAGYSILGAVFIGTMALAALLGRKADGSRRAEIRDQQSAIRGQQSEISGQNADNPTSDFRPLTSELPPPKSEIRNPKFPLRLPRLALLAALVWVVGVEAAAESWYASHERNLVPTPTWSVRWPESLPGFRDLEIDENVRATLRFDDGRQARWAASADASADKAPGRFAATWSMFFFRWEPGTTSIVRARAHRPDVCLPNTGWRVAEDYGVRSYPVADGGSIPFRHFSFLQGDGKAAATAHAFFCQREDRVPPAAKDGFDVTTGGLGEWGRWDRLRVVREGLRNQGQQVLEIVLLTANQLDGSGAQAQFAELVRQVVTVKPAGAADR